MEKRLAGIDILRGSAALAVVVAHLRKWDVDVCGATAPTLCTWVGRMSDAMGAWGVGLFFVLSGLCIHLPAARAAQAGTPLILDMKRYAARRFWRIYPPHLIVLLLSWAVAAILVVPAHFASLISVPTTPQVFAHLFLVHSFFPSAIYSINVVLWTIGIEAHFYVLYPLLLRMRRRFSLAALTAGLFGLSLLLRLLAGTMKGHVELAVLAENFPGRWWEWTLGALVAEVALGSRRRLPELSSTAIGVGALASLLAMTVIDALPHGIAIAAVVAPFVYATLVLAAVKMSLGSQVGLLGRGTLWLGHRSYSLYLVHPIVLSVVVTWLAPLRQVPVFPRLLVVLAMSVLGSAAYFGLVERWFLAGRSPFSAARASAAGPTPTLGA